MESGIDLIATYYRAFETIIQLKQYYYKSLKPICIFLY